MAKTIKKRYIMARRIKRFFVFLLFSLCFSLVSGGVSVPDKKTGNGSKDEARNKSFALNSAEAGICCPPGFDPSSPYC